MDETDMGFRTVLVGGFHRDDVIEYIKKQTQENAQRVDELRQENDELLEQNEALNRVYDEDKDIAQIKTEILKRIDMGEDVDDVLEDLSDKLGCDKNELIMKIREYYIENTNEGISY